MSKVYIVSQGVYSDYSIVAVYDTREQADAMVEALNGRGAHYDQAQVEEYEVNGSPATLITQWTICLNSDGVVMDVSTRPDQVWRPASVTTKIYEPSVMVMVWSDTIEQALKVAYDKFAEHKAQSAGIAD